MSEQVSVTTDRKDAAAKIREYAARYYTDTQAEGFEVAARIAEGWLRRPVADTLEALAVAMSGVGHHRDPCRLPDTECLCGLCDFRKEAAELIRATRPPS